MNRNTGPGTLRKLIWFSTICCFLFFAACGEGKKQEEREQEVTEQNQEQEKEETKTILFFGNSLTAGMGLDPEEAFPSLIQERIDSLDLPYQVINAGLSGETTAAGKNRIEWVLNQKVDVFVLELGANDGLRGVPVEETRKNLQAIIDTVREKNPDTEIILAGMQLPPNLGKEYTYDFREIFPELAEKNNVHLVPFLLEGVAGNPDLNLQDGIHPNVQGQKILANNVWEVLEEVLEKEQV